MAILTAWVCGTVRAGETPSLTLDQYLNQVKTAGPAYSAAENAVQGLAKQKSQTDLIYSPQLVGHVVRVDDRSEQASDALEAMYGDQTRVDDYGVDLVKKWKYGLTTSVGYGWTKTMVADSVYLPEKYYTVAPNASATLSLLRDFMGRQTRAQMDHGRSLIESGQFAAAHQREALLYKARAAYWKLQFARKEVEVRKDTLARAVTLVAWSERRVRMNLVDDNEALQAQAGKQVRAIELEQSVESERLARVAFNRLRGVDGKDVPEDLGDLDTAAATINFDWPVKTPKSWDVRSAEAKITSEKAAWQDAKSNAKPDLNLFASYTSNGLDESFSPAQSQSADGKRPTTKVGAAIVIPLDVFTAQKAADGYKLNYRSAEAACRDTRLQSDQSWEQIKERLSDVNTRLAMATEIESIQKRKAEKEHEQFNVGRSTQFQIQTYETDYAMARLMRLGVQVEKLCLWAEGEWLMAADKEDAQAKSDKTQVNATQNEVLQ
jgi:outer membrane protein TolC